MNIQQQQQTTISTIVFTMTSLGLYQTIANLYSKCITLTTTSINNSQQKQQMMNPTQREDLCTFLIEGYQAQLKWIASQKTVNTTTKKDCDTLKHLDLYSARTVQRAWEDAQLYAMSLMKHANCSLYQSWCAFAAIQHLKSCQILLDVLKDNVDDETKTDSEEKTDEVKKLEQKVNIFLPRLGEMLMQRVCSANNDSNLSETKFPPSADDWRLYVDCLTIQEKFEDAIQVLSAVKCGTEKQGRQINDEQDVKHHLGSLIQLSERERVEIIADLNIKLGKYDVAMELYTNSLLEMLPDQWSYWEAILNCSLKSYDMNYNAVVESCSQIVESVMKKQELLRSEGKASRVPIRAPYLFRVHMIAEGIRQCHTNDAEGLCDAIIEYANVFNSLVSCCFQDLRPYIEILTSLSKNGHESETVMKIVDFAKKIRQENDLDTSHSQDRKQSLEEKKERRSKLRAYIFSIKICLELWYQCVENGKDDSENKDVDEYFSNSVPCVDDMLDLWANSLDLGSNPNDGGQKETLPADDLVLLANQLLIYQNRAASKETKEIGFILCASILEAALSQSPYNPYFKIAAINVYAKLGVATRANEIFNDMKISNIQQDSCSYLILNHLVNHNLANEAVSLAGKILNLHTSSARDVAKFMPKAFDNGNLYKGLEMINFQRFEMNHSAQLLQAKSIVMNFAPLLTQGAREDIDEPSSYIGALHGLCGNKSSDTLRAEEIVRNAPNDHGGPSLLSFANFKNLDNDNSVYPLSDNRDFSINQFEIINRTRYPDSVQRSLTNAHINSILTRIILFVDVCKPPKKGKVVKYAIGDDVELRSNSVLQAITNAETFFNEEENNTHTILWSATFKLGRAICALGVGKSTTQEAYVSSEDSLSKREVRCTQLLTSACEDLDQALNALEPLLDGSGSEREIIVNLLSGILLPLYTIIRTTANLFGIYTWGKRKRYTKQAVGALASVALSFKNLLNLLDERLDSYEHHEYEDSVNELVLSILPKSFISMQLNNENGFIKIIEDLKVQKDAQITLLMRLFLEMIQEMETFDVVQD